MVIQGTAAAEQQLDSLRKGLYNATVTLAQITSTEHGHYMRLRVKPDVGETAYRMGSYTTLGMVEEEPRPEGFPESEGKIGNKKTGILRPYTLSPSMLVDDVDEMLQQDPEARAIMQGNIEFKRTRHSMPEKERQEKAAELAEKSTYNKKFLSPLEQEMFEFFIAIDEHGQLTPRMYLNLEQGSRVFVSGRFLGHYGDNVDDIVASDVDVVYTGSNGAGLPGQNSIALAYLHRGFLDDPARKIIGHSTVKLGEELGEYRRQHELAAALFPNYEFILNETRREGREKVYPQEQIRNGSLENDLLFNFGENTAAYLCGSLLFAGGISAKRGLNAIRSTGHAPEGSDGGAYLALLGKGIPDHHIQIDAW